MTVFGGLMALVTPYNKGMMIGFTFLEQTFFGWPLYESVAFTQLGVHQHDLGMSGGLAGVMARYAGGSLAQAVYVSILTNTKSACAAVTVPTAAIAAGLPSENAETLLLLFRWGRRRCRRCREWCENIDARMSDKTEISLENDVNAEKNEFHRFSAPRRESSAS
ncbi:hypothetical protein H2201_007852 [Coniosporium apollinis]|uniref:Major facilitator superfamily (MFS) profile domain-containing protein n=1 Tax=Coniosporium apollinis TaxID=61459 RepID=A0ABQ9NIJ7_9PEZI|nr:hypothetical protein H2201_007852 [Coniosporium apollinis]